MKQEYRKFSIIMTDRFLVGRIHFTQLFNLVRQLTNTSQWQQNAENLRQILTST